MLKKFGIPVILCVIVILTGGDQGQKMMKPVLTPEPTTVEQPMSEAEAQGTVYPEITFENVLELMPGERYRMRPTESHEGTGDEGVIYSVSWGSVGQSEGTSGSFHGGRSEGVCVVLYGQR